MRLGDGVEDGSVDGGVGGVDDGELVDGAVLERKGKVGALFADGPGKVEAVTLLADGALGGGGEGIAGVHPGRGIGGEKSAVVIFGAGFGVDLDAPTAERRLTVFRGKEVGRDVDVGDGVFGRDRGGILEAVDGNGGAAGAAAGCSGELLQLAQQVVGVVGKGLELLAGEDEAVAASGCGYLSVVVAGVDRDGGLGGGGEMDGEGGEVRGG